MAKIVGSITGEVFDCRTFCGEHKSTSFCGAEKDSKAISDVENTHCSNQKKGTHPMRATTGEVFDVVTFLYKWDSMLNYQSFQYSKS